MDKESGEDFKVIDRRGTERPAEGPAENAPSKEEHQIDFSTFILSLATGALIHMGLAPDPSTKKVQKNLDLAKQNIDLLALLQDKTQGNLNEDEGKLLEHLLTEVRLRFVQAKP